MGVMLLDGGEGLIAEGRRGMGRVEIVGEGGEVVMRRGGGEGLVVDEREMMVLMGSGRKKATGYRPSIGIVPSVARHLNPLVNPALDPDRRWSPDRAEILAARRPRSDSWTEEEAARAWPPLWRGRSPSQRCVSWQSGRGSLGSGEVRR
jgi:hypothetical protein